MNRGLLIEFGLQRKARSSILPTMEKIPTCTFNWRKWCLPQNCCKLTLIFHLLSQFWPKLDLLFVSLLILKIFKNEIKYNEVFIFFNRVPCANFLYSNLSRNYVKEPNFGGGYSLAGKWYLSIHIPTTNSLKLKA